jgi:hypothetical protein
VTHQKIKNQKKIGKQRDGKGQCWRDNTGAWRLEVIIHLPFSEKHTTCMDHAVFFRWYGGFPPMSSRSLILRQFYLLNPATRFNPKLGVAGFNSRTVGIYFRAKLSERYVGLRQICNLDELLTIAKGVANNSQLFTTHANMTLAAQVDLFNRFDIILGVHGSHWALSWFAERPLAIVELQGPTYTTGDLKDVMKSKGKSFFVSLGHSFALPHCAGVDKAAQKIAVTARNPQLG